MSIRKDPRSPYYQYDFKRNGERFHGSTGCKTKRDAERYEDNLKRQIALGDHARPPITLDRAAEEFWQAGGQHDKNAATTMAQTARLTSIIGKNMTLGTITMREFRAFIATRRGHGVSNATINRELGVARRIWKLALSNGYDVPVPETQHAIVWSDLKLDEPKERVRELSREDEARLFAKLGPDLAAVVRFALLSGQRKSAVIGLRWDRVSLPEMRAEVHTKGDKWHSFPLTLAMAELILMQPRVDDCPFVFTYRCDRPSPARADRPRRYRGKRYPFSGYGWARQWKKALAEAGIEDFRFHDLRHTSATRIVRASGNLKAASKLLGHTDIATTSRYAHVLEDDVRDAMRAAELRNSDGKALQNDAENGSILPAT